MVKKNQKSNKITIKAGSSIGESSAEDDHHFLAHCFVDKFELSQILNLNDNNKSIILGRTGAGKSALMKRIEQSDDISVAVLDPQALFFQHVTNSVTFDFFVKLGANLDILFSTLWKHILLVEALNLYFQNQSNFEKVCGSFRGKEKSLKFYVDKWSDDFWDSSEVSVKEVVKSIERNLTASAGVSADIINLGAKGAESISNEERFKIYDRITSAVNTPLASQINKAIVSLNELTVGRQNSFYILLDELDENWMISDYKYRLIRSLVETIRKFRKVRRLKIVVAMRTDLYERTIIETAKNGFQSEKYKGLFVDLKWTAVDLRKLVDSRVNELFKWQYTKNSVSFSNIFPPQIRGEDSFHYLMKRTMMRPRDIIDFINFVLEESIGSVVTQENDSIYISSKRISSAEEKYSFDRRSAIVSEWAIVHPQLKTYLLLISAMQENFSFSNTKIDEEIESIALNLCDDTKIVRKDGVRRAAESYLENESDFAKHQLKQEIFSVLYKIGVLSVKLTSSAPFKNSTDSVAFLSPGAIDGAAKFKVQPMFWRAFGVTPNIG